MRDWSNNFHLIKIDLSTRKGKFIWGTKTARNRTPPSWSSKMNWKKFTQPASGHLNLSLVYLLDDRNGTPVVKEPLCMWRKQGEKIKKLPEATCIEQTKVNLNTSIFTIDKIWKQSKCPLMDKWIQKMFLIQTQTVGYYSAIKKETLPLG